MAVTTTRRRRAQAPERLGPYPTGSDQAIAIVRAYIAGEQRRRREAKPGKRPCANASDTTPHVRLTAVSPSGLGRSIEAINRTGELKTMARDDDLEINAEAAAPYRVTGHPMHPPSAVPLPEDLRAQLQATPTGGTVYATLTAPQLASLRAQNILA